MNLYFIGLLYGVPIVSGAILIWSLSIVNDSYAGGAVLGLLGSFGALCGAAFSHLIIKFVRSSASGNRDRVLFSFKPLMIITQFNAILITICNGISLVAASFYAPAILTGYYLPKLTLFIGLAAIYSSFKVAKVILSATPKAEITVNGTLIGRSQAKRLWDTVDNVAKNLQTPPPERIILSLDDNVCVTEAAVKTADQVYSGRSLILSLPLIKMLSEEQTTAVIAHELAHFSGNDTKYSLKFFPIFRGARASIQGINKSIENFGGTAVAAIPAMALLNSFLAAFAGAEAEMSRQCEKDADTKAATIAGHLNLVKALSVIHALDLFWKQCDETLFKAFHENGKGTDNIIRFYSDVVSEEKIGPILNTDHRIFNPSSVPFPPLPKGTHRVFRRNSGYIQGCGPLDKS